MTEDRSGRHRFWLWRAKRQLEIAQEESGRTMLFVMLNPSTATDKEDDPTVRRCQGFAEREGCDRVEVVNLFGVRATNPAELYCIRPHNRLDELNDIHIEVAVARADVVVAAWGAHGGRFAGRATTVREILRRREVLCLGKTKGDQPRHPLYVAADKSLELYDASWPMQEERIGRRQSNIADVLTHNVAVVRLAAERGVRTE